MTDNGIRPKSVEQQPRRPRGTPGAGQWAPAEHDDAGLPLVPVGVRPELVSEVMLHPHDADPRLLNEATEEEVNWILDHGSSTHIVTLSLRDDLTKDQYLRIVEPSSPLDARLNVLENVELGISGVALKASYDPHPAVRAYALAYGWDMPEDRRRELMADSDTVRAAKKLKLDINW